MGTSWCDAAVISLGFSRFPRALVDATRTVALFASIPKPILPARGFQGLGGLCRKDNSSQSSGGRLLVVSRCRDGNEVPNGSATRFWNMDQIPFRRVRGIKRAIKHYVNHLAIEQGFPKALGSTDSCSTAVHTKPFSTSVLQGLSGVFATTTKICTRDGSSQVHTQSLPRHPCDLPTRRGFGTSDGLLCPGGRV